MSSKFAATHEFRDTFDLNQIFRDQHRGPDTDLEKGCRVPPVIPEFRKPESVANARYGAQKVRPKSKTVLLGRNVPQSAALFVRTLDA